MMMMMMMTNKKQPLVNTTATTATTTGPGLAQWLRHCATSRAVPGSNPGGVGHRDFSRVYRLSL